jgi:hypothetical protein
MKGRGGGEFISNAEAEKLGLEKPKPGTVEPTKPASEPIKTSEPPKVESPKPVEPTTKATTSSAPKVEPTAPAESAKGGGGGKVGKALGIIGTVWAIWEVGEQIYKLDSKSMPLDEYNKQVTTIVAKAVAEFGLAMVGAILGGMILTAAFPGVGTIVGIIAGGAAGFLAQYAFGGTVDDLVEKIVTKLYQGGKENSQITQKQQDIPSAADTSTDAQEIFNESVKNNPLANDLGVRAELESDAHTQAKANIQKQGGDIKGYVAKSLTMPVEEIKATTEKPKVEAPKGNTEAGVTPDIDMGFQIGGRKEFDKELVNQQAATPGVTPDIAGVMPSANETPPPPVQEKGKVEKPLSEEATKLIDQYMKEYQYGLKAMGTVLPLETKKEDLVAAADEKYSFDPMMLRKLSEIKRTPGKAVEKLKEKKLEAAEKLLQNKRIKSAESSDAGNLGTDYKATELTPTVETPTFDAMGNASGVNITGGEEVQSAMEAARASDEGSMGLITTAREVSPELQKNSIAMERASNISKFGRSNAMGMDAFMGYDEPTPVLPTAEQVAQGQTEAVKKADARAQMISGQQTSNNQAPIIIKQGDNINNVTNNNTSGGNSGGVGSPSRIQNPWDALTLGKPWEAYP